MTGLQRGLKSIFKKKGVVIMAKNEGKKFEQDFMKSCPEEWFCYRLKDSSGSWSNTDVSRFTPTNMCDFFLFTGEKFYGVECKSFKGKSIPYKNIKDNQINGLSEMCIQKPILAYGCFIFNFRDINKTFYMSAQWLLEIQSQTSRKSLSLDECEKFGLLIPQKLKRVRYKYDLEGVF